jgi:hypothetical protein
MQLRLPTLDMKRIACVNPACDQVIWVPVDDPNPPACCPVHRLLPSPLGGVGEAARRLEAGG